MKALSESPVLQSLLKWRNPNLSAEALAWVRETFQDDDIEPHQLVGSPLDFLKAREQQGCSNGCPGRADCPDGGMKWYVREQDLHGKRIFVVRVGPCRMREDAERQNKAALAVEASKIPEGMKRCTMESFVTKDMEPAVRTAKGIAMATLEDGSSLVLGGGTGVGKTHLAIAMIGELVKRGKCAIFVPVVDLLDEIRAGYEVGKADAIQRAVREADCVALDDLGAHRTTEWTAERLFAIFDDRYRNGRQTIVTTNAGSMKELETMLGDRGARITSRLSETAQAFFIKAKDFRTRKNVQQKLPA